jgi:hypothetical protein
VSEQDSAKVNRFLDDLDARSDEIAEEQKGRRSRAAVPRWEYLVVRIYEHSGWLSWVDSHGNDGKLDLVKKAALAGDTFFPATLLTDLGEKGWELTGVTSAGEYATTLFFKRPKAED